MASGRKVILQDGVRVVVARSWKPPEGDDAVASKPKARSRSRSRKRGAPPADADRVPSGNTGS